MAQKVTAMDIRMAAALAGQVENVAAFCREQQISRQTFYKLRRRFGEDGLDGLQDRSRRPLILAGTDPGRGRGGGAAHAQAAASSRASIMAPQSIVWSLQRDGDAEVPSRSTVWRILTRHGAITPAAAETSEVSDQTVLLRPAQRVLAVRLDRVAAGRWHARWPSPAASMTTPAIVVGLRAGPATPPVSWSGR